MPALPGVTRRFHGARLLRRPSRRPSISRSRSATSRSGEPVLVRVQTACFPGDVFGSAACDCGAQLRGGAAGDRARGARRAALRHPVAGATRCSATSRRTCCTRRRRASPAREHKLRDFGLGAQVLAASASSDLRLLTNNPKKIAGLEGYGMSVVERVPLEMPATRHNLALHARQARSRRAPASSASSTRASSTGDSSAARP